MARDRLYETEPIFVVVVVVVVVVVIEEGGVEEAEEATKSAVPPSPMAAVLSARAILTSTCSRPSRSERETIPAVLGGGAICGASSGASATPDNDDDPI